VAVAAVLLVASLRAETLTVATYNIENYTAADRMTAAGYRQDYPKPEAAKQALRSVLCALNADVLVLQEMGPRPYLEELRRDLRAEGLDYPYASLLEAADDARHVAVLAKRPFKSVTPHPELDFKYFDGRERVKRGVLEVVLPTGAGDLTLWAVHLKSRFTDRPDDPNSALRRAGEAGAIRDFILKRHPDPQTARFAVLGDFNDNKISRPIRAFLERGKTVIAELLPAADSRGEVWTRAYAREDSYERPDFILVSPGLKPFVRDGTAKIFDRPETRVASDHRPVVMVLEFK
jgi:endonuclease/exonuclease/phosphatase family metal-dependent hydrolase